MFDHLLQSTIFGESQAPKPLACHMFTFTFNVNCITFSYVQKISFTVPNRTTTNKHQPESDLTFFLETKQTTRPTTVA